jgi:nucleoid-associated protein YgaU
VVGRAANPFTDGPCRGLDRIMTWLRSLGVPDVFPSGVSGSRDRQTWQRAGHFTHAVTPDNDHTDPGRINPRRLFRAGDKGKHNGQHDGHHDTHVYVVKAGDTLFSIADAFLGSGPRWPQIYELNKAVIGNDPSKIKVGQEFKIPED